MASHRSREKFELPVLAFAIPSMYAIGGWQFIAIATDGGKSGTKRGDSEVTFALESFFPRRAGDRRQPSHRGRDTRDGTSASDGPTTQPISLTNRGIAFARVDVHRCALAFFEHA